MPLLWRERTKLHYLDPVPLHEICKCWIANYERRRLQGALPDAR